MSKREKDPSSEDQTKPEPDKAASPMAAQPMEGEEGDFNDAELNKALETLITDKATRAAFVKAAADFVGALDPEKPTKAGVVNYNTIEPYKNSLRKAIEVLKPEQIPEFMTIIDTHVFDKARDLVIETPTYEILLEKLVTDSTKRTDLAAAISLIRLHLSDDGSITQNEMANYKAKLQTAIEGLEPEKIQTLATILKAAFRQVDGEIIEKEELDPILRATDQIIRIEKVDRAITIISKSKLEHVQLVKYETYLGDAIKGLKKEEVIEPIKIVEDRLKDHPQKNLIKDWTSKALYKNGFARLPSGEILTFDDVSKIQSPFASLSQEDRDRAEKDLSTPGVNLEVRNLKAYFQMNGLNNPSDAQLQQASDIWEKYLIADKVPYRKGADTGKFEFANFHDRALFEKYRQIAVIMVQNASTGKALDAGLTVPNVKIPKPVPAVDSGLTVPDPSKLPSPVAHLNAEQLEDLRLRFERDSSGISIFVFPKTMDPELRTKNLPQAMKIVEKYLIADKVPCQIKTESGSIHFPKVVNSQKYQQIADIMAQNAYARRPLDSGLTAPKVQIPEPAKAAAQAPQAAKPEPARAAAAPVQARPVPTKAAAPAAAQPAQAQQLAKPAPAAQAKPAPAVEEVQEPAKPVPTAQAPAKTEPAATKPAPQKQPTKDELEKSLSFVKKEARQKVVKSIMEIVSTTKLEMQHLVNYERSLLQALQGLKQEQVQQVISSAEQALGDKNDGFVKKMTDNVKKAIEFTIEQPPKEPPKELLILKKLDKIINENAQDRQAKINPKLLQTANAKLSNVLQNYEMEPDQNKKIEVVKKGLKEFGKWVDAQEKHSLWDRFKAALTGARLSTLPEQDREVLRNIKELARAGKDLSSTPSNRMNSERNKKPEKPRQR